MRYRLELLDEAMRDAADIREYLKQFYSGTVHKFVDALDNSTSLLQDNPYMGVKYHGYRKLMVGNYLVFYTVDEEEKNIKVHRVLHGSREFEDLI